MNQKSDTLANTIGSLANSIGFPWMLILVVSLFLVIGLLTWLLVKKEKALQLITFSISPVGLKLTYELNTDEKIRILAIENLALQNEVKLLKSKVTDEQFKSFGVLLILIVILAFEKMKPKTNRKQSLNKKS